jgi:ADP-ribose pyrophosphatase YjhB (NUDIX family)
MPKLKQPGIIPYILASGPAIIKDKKMLVVLDDKDPFLKFPGGRIRYPEDLKRTCLRRTKEEIGVDIEIIRPLEPMLLWKKQSAGKEIPVILIHWLAKLKPKQIPREGKLPREIFWIDSKHRGCALAPNVKYFLGKLKKEGIIS